ncbi:MAG: hypothetical protein U9N45_06570, partial [Gemmatimonadota bacterium]|nr:hypothetical protein [Gemmatimonadota bacterium]
SHGYKIMTVLFAALVLILTVTVNLQAQEKALDRARKSPMGSMGDSISSKVGKAAGKLFGKKQSAKDYMTKREHFSYPHTRKNDPFDFPLSETGPTEDTGPKLGEVELTGVLYSPGGRSLAIMITPEGDSFILREGDMIGLAEVTMIDPSSITFSIKEYGRVRTFVKELKPLMEEKNGKSPSAAGSSGERQEEETEPRDKYEYDERAVPPPRDRR